MKLCPRCRRPFQAPDWCCPACGHRPPRLGEVVLCRPDDWQDEIHFPDTHQELYRLEEGSFWFRHRNRVVIDALRRHFPQAANLLEVGCGTAYVLAGVARARPELELTGSDLSPQALALAARRLPRARWVQADLCRLPFQEEFDLVAALDVLEHIPDENAALAAIRRALRPGGGLLLTVPQHPWLWSALDGISGHQRRYRRAELRQRLEEAGFEVGWMGSFVSLLLPLLLVSRLAWKLGGKDLTPSRAERHLSLPPLLDRGLEAACALELPLLRAGVSLPLGGSLLCVARRA